MKFIAAISLINFIFLNLVPPNLFAQPPRVVPERDLPVVITIGRPNIWSFEQAHYLLARMHHRNRELEAASLQNLDPNKVNATRIKLLRQMLGISADFSQTKKPRSEDGEVTETQTSENKAKLEGGLPESVIKDFEKFMEDPKLNASTELANYVNLQYEIIAQQLTTLRDEVGNGERLVFLELPASVYTTPKKGDKRLAQIWWRIQGFSRVDADVAKATDIIKKEVHQIKFEVEKFLEIPENEKTPPITLTGLPRIVYQLDNLSNKIDTAERTLGAEKKGKIPELKDKIRTVRVKIGEMNSLRCKVPDKLFAGDENLPPPTASELIKSAISAWNNQSFKTTDNVKVKRGLAPDCTEYVPLYFEDLEEKDAAGQPKVKIIKNSEETVRTVDLIPRQSSLNINETYDSVNGLNLWGGFAWLFGLGVKSNFQRQKEDFQQFIHQEIYASGFGKGETDFGWTFGPLPGTKRLSPGLRTTYAVIIVPEDAETLNLKAKGCFFKQSYNQPYNYKTAEKWKEEDDDKFCEEEQDFFINVPNGGDYQGFNVSEIRYLEGQEPGNRIVVAVKGKNFSPQIGVTINGIPLCQSVGIAQPFLDKVNTRDTSCGEKDGIGGQVEYISFDEIIFSFKMPKEFKGTPTIHFIGPGKVAYLNRLPHVRVNNFDRTLDNSSFMFGVKSADKPVAIKDLKLYRTGQPDILGALLIGEKFKNGVQVYVNGIPATIYLQSDKQIDIRFPNLSDEKLNVTVIQNNYNNTAKDTDTSTFPNLPTLTINKVETLSYEAAKGSEPGVLIVKIEGKGFTGLSKTIVGADIKKSDLIEMSPSEAILKLVNPESLVQVGLKNSLGQTAKTVIIRPVK
jgi:hypothetical protein